MSSEAPWTVGRLASELKGMLASDAATGTGDNGHAAFKKFAHGFS